MSEIAFSSEPNLPELSSVASARLELRPLRLADADAFQALTDAPTITEAVDLLSTPFTRGDAERLIAGNGDGRDAFWGVRLRESRQLIGVVGTHLVGAGEIEIGYWLAAVHQRRGYASEAVAALLDALASAYPTRRVFAECRPENAASLRLLRRAGFASDGVAGRRAGRIRLVFHS